VLFGCMASHIIISLLHALIFESAGRVVRGKLA
jgi:hypothetical protein